MATNTLNVTASGPKIRNTESEFIDLGVDNTVNQEPSVSELVPELEQVGEEACGS